MSTPHPLNQAVIAQALHDLRNGQLHRCQLMGFTAQELEALKNPALVSVLLNAKVPWCSVTVNHEVMQRLLKQVRDIENEIATIDRMLRLGASTEMVSELYGLTHQEVALRRQMLDLPQRKGRWPVLSEQQDAALWKDWHAQIRARRIDLKDDSELLSLSMDLAEQQALPLSVIWSAVRGWIAEGLT